jgi:hypothetical protein
MKFPMKSWILFMVDIFHFEIFYYSEEEYEKPRRAKIVIFK